MSNIIANLIEVVDTLDKKMKDGDHFEPSVHWINPKKFPLDGFGIVYAAMRKKDHCWYVGCRQLVKKVKGKYVPNPNWMDYKTSSKKVQKSIANGDKWVFVIMDEAKDKPSLKYKELQLQLCSRALWDEFSFNQLIQCRISNRKDIE